MKHIFPFIFVCIFIPSCVGMKTIKRATPEERVTKRKYEMYPETTATVYCVEEPEIGDTTKVKTHIFRPFNIDITIEKFSEEARETGMPYSIEEGEEGAKISIFNPFRLDIKLESPGTTVKDSIFSVQIGAFTEKINAIELKEKATKDITCLSTVREQDVFVVYVEPYYKVRVGKSLPIQAAMTLKSELQRLGYVNAFISKTGEVSTNVEEPVIKEGKFFIQIGAFVDKKYAEEKAQEVRKKTEKPVFVKSDLPYYKVIISGFEDRIEAEKLRDILGYEGSFVIEE